MEQPASANPKENRFYSRYVWLFYSAFFFIDPVLSHSTKKWIELAVFYPVFLFLYLYPDEGKRYSNLCVFAMFVLGLLYFPFNQSSSGTIIYVAAFIPFLAENSRKAMLLLAGAVIIFGIDGYLTHFSPWTWVVVDMLAVVVGVANFGQAKEHRANQKLKRAHEEIEHLAKVAERERIARDLHDLLGHTLSMITLKAELAGRLIVSEPDRAHQEMSEVEQTARRALAEVRQAVRGYRSEGINAELDRAGHTLGTAGVRLMREGSVPASCLSAAEETVVAMVLREAVTNVVRHARARFVRVAFQQAGGSLVLTIADNGEGGVQHEGSGIRGMRERIEALGGHFLWQSSLRAGTTLHCEFPLSGLTPGGLAQLPPVKASETADGREVSAPVSGLLSGGAH